MSVHRTSRAAALLVVLALLAACGTPQEPAPTATPDRAAQAGTPLPAPTATEGSADEPTPIIPTAPPTVEPTVDATAAAIERGRTPEGYNYLGSPEAPVTLQDYSDFF